MNEWKDSEWFRVWLELASRAQGVVEQAREGNPHSKETT